MSLAWCCRLPLSAKTGRTSSAYWAPGRLDRLSFVQRPEDVAEARQIVADRAGVPSEA